MVPTTLFLSLLGLAGVISIAYGLRKGRARKQRIALCALRVAALAIVALAFVQPTLRLSRLAPERSVLGLLVDVSGSMERFNADSAWKHLIPALQRASGGTPELTVNYMAFGDSLRPLTTESIPAFDAPRSHFPSSREMKKLEDADEVILLTDGNWSNTTPPRLLPKTTYHYVPLRQIRHRSFLRIEPAGSIPPTPRDSNSTAAVHLSGFTSIDNAVHLVIRHRGRPIGRRTVPVRAGRFADSVRLSLPTNRVGTHLYEITARLPDTTLQSSCYLVQPVVRRRINVTLSADAPSLDKRFIALAVDRHPRLRRIATPSKADAIFFFSRPKRELAGRSGKSGDAAAMFIGTLPCATVNSLSVNTLRPRFPGSTAPHDLPPSLPAPSALLSCDSEALRIVRQIITGSVTDDDSSTKTVSLLFEAVHRNDRILVLAARGTWRWDFWPQGVEGEQTTEKFTDFLMERVIELVETNSNHSFFAYPVESPVYDTDSLKLAVVFPASLRDTSDATLSVVILAENGDTVHRSEKRMNPAGSSPAPLILPPLKAGLYHYECRVPTPTGESSHQDRLRVSADDAELRVTGQNRVLLEQIASPLDLSDTAFARTVTERLVAGRRSSTITRTFHVRQSAYMLALLLGVLAVEWFLRRMWRLD
ncbi:MAG: hypothetical protein GF344_03155 [Chitinivibrionales bacterium]|nr:hypothetical protein [Chitinivibrionales bacterium]MBD3356077.1 hypothetical protein [Chitinivibrionales bacterium]